MNNITTEQHRADGAPTLSNDDLVHRIKLGDTELFELLMRRLNRRLYFVARSILHNEAEVEDVMQEAYIRGWQNIDSFRGPLGIGAWFSKIVRNEALMRIRKDNRHETTDIINIAETHMDESTSPESEVNLIESRMLLEQAIRELPDVFQLTYILREIEQLSVKETADSLEIDSTTVKTRVHRARQLLRKRLGTQFDMPIDQVFQFAGDRCDRIVTGVMRRIAES